MLRISWIIAAVVAFLILELFQILSMHIVDLQSLYEVLFVQLLLKQLEQVQLMLLLATWTVLKGQTTQIYTNTSSLYLQSF